MNVLRKKVQSSFYYLRTMTLFAILWYFLSRLIENRLLLPSPPDVAKALWDLLLHQHFLLDIFISLKRLILGYLLAAAVGISLGFLLGLSRQAESIISPVVEVLRPISPIAWIPIAMFLFGVGDGLAICIIFYGASFQFLLNTIAGVKSINRKLFEVSLTVGASRAAQDAARSHTGSLAGRYEIYESSLKQAGTIVVREIRELLDVAKILTILQPSSGRNVAVMSFQAGPGILLTDEVIRNGLKMATFSKQAQEGLDGLLPPLTIRTNPVDMAFARNEETFEKTVHLILSDKHVDVLVVFLLYHPFMTPGRIKSPLLRQKQQSNKPILLCANSPRGLIEDEIEELEANGVPVYNLPDRTIQALRGLIQYGEILKRKKPWDGEREKGKREKGNGCKGGE